MLPQIKIHYYDVEEDKAYKRMIKPSLLEDDDFEGEPEEKAMLYYKCIVQKDD